MKQVWNPDIHISIGTVYELITAQFIDLKPWDVKYFAEGWDNYIYEVNNEYLFRFPRRKFAIPFIKTEIHILPFLQTKKMSNIPIITHMGEPNQKYPHPFYGYKKILGKPFTCFKLSPNDYQQLAADLGLFLRKLHDVSMNGSNHVNLRSDELNRMNPITRTDKFKENLASIKRINPIYPIEKWNNLMMESVKKGFITKAPNVIVHGDLYALQIIINDQNRFNGVIDWGDVHWGDPAVDLAVLHTIIPYQYHNTVYENYGKVTEDDWHRARFRALYHSAVLLNYGYDLNDQSIINIGEYAFQNMLGYTNS